MPELPEVETTRRGIAPRVEGRTIRAVIVRDPRLRWPVPDDIGQRLAGRRVRVVERRAKYLVVRTDGDDLIIHLGMSGRLRIVPAALPPGPHDHVDIVLGSDALRLTDPRRFGSVLVAARAEEHRLLAALGPEPLSPAFTGAVLHAAARGRRLAVKAMLMDHHVVVGVGNIYANEALFMAGIHPGRAAGRIGAARYGRLAAAVRQVLEAAIEAGGTTLRDYSGADGAPGYFVQALAVYGRDGQPCLRCGTPLVRSVIGQRATVHCPRCQR